MSETEAAELVGEAASAIYPLTGGNPFYLEQVARVSGAERLAPRAADESVPPAVAAALAAELSALAPDTRRALEGPQSPATRSSPRSPPRWRSSTSGRR